MNKMMKRIKDDPMCLFFGESERKKQKKLYKSLYERLKKNVRIHDDDFFQKR